MTFVGFIIGFINEEYRVLVWTFSFILMISIIAFVIFNEYISRIENNEFSINQIKKDLNIERRLTILETKMSEHFLKK